MLPCHVSTHPCRGRVLKASFWHDAPGQACNIPMSSYIFLYHILYKGSIISTLSGLGATRFSKLLVLLLILQRQGLRGRRALLRHLTVAERFQVARPARN